MKRLYCVVKRGRSAGTILTPHLHKDNCFVISLTRFGKDYMRVKQESDLHEWVDKGYSVRMSSPTVKSHRSPSLICPGSMETREV